MLGDESGFEGDFSPFFVYATMEDGEGFSREVSDGVFGGIFVCPSLDGCMAYINMRMKEMEEKLVLHEEGKLVVEACKRTCIGEGRREEGRQ